MAKPPRDLSPAHFEVYFLTISCAGGKFLFQSERMARLFLRTLADYRAPSKFEVHEFVLMPNHVHLLVRREERSRWSAPCNSLRVVSHFEPGRNLASREKFGSAAMLTAESGMPVIMRITGNMFTQRHD
jgi:REP element-mobilizing transposase RayT